jgi:O-acetylhomoserine/O-acetylserine sulfhydrylase-like pyridoxal-dependent enzyme
MTSPRGSSRNSKAWRFATRCIHGGGYQPDATGATQVPIHMTSSYSFENAEAAAAAFAGESDAFIYSRLNNPTNDVLEKRLANLEGVQAGLVTSSGLSAVLMVLTTLAQAGDEVLVSPKLYGGAFRQFAYNAPRMGVTPVWIPHEKPTSEWESLITPKTRFIYIETPANPTMFVTDIAEVAALAKAKGIPLVVDNTFCTPYLQQPAELGGDIIIHSTTKYLTGNSTALGGIVLGSKAYIDSVRVEDYRNLGPAGSPFNSWLVLLSLETLPLRMDRHCQNAMAVADYLETHPRVSSVTYPGLSSHPQYDIAQKQMAQPGAMIAFDIEGGFDAGRRFLNRLKLASIVANLGDSRTLAIHPASTTHSPLSPEEQLHAGVRPGLIRLSIGLEAIEDILADFEQAFQD